MARVKDLSPKFSTRSAEQELQLPSFDTPIGQLIGGLSTFSNSFKRGSGSQVFGSDYRGIWLGAADFADAPFRVDMQGRIFLTVKGGGITVDTVNNAILVNNGTIDIVSLGFLEGAY